MPSYADEIAARKAAAFSDRNANARNASRSGPVRLTISRGEAIVCENGDVSYAENWEEEEIMDAELVNSVDEEIYGLSTARFGNDEDRHGRLKIDGVSLGASLHALGGALLVLDTNTLLSALPLLKTLFHQCLERNTFALENCRFERSAISLIIPHVVLSELDGLKSKRSAAHDGKTVRVANEAQAANHWILNSLRLQKKQEYSVNNGQGGQHSRQAIPESAWALHVESSTHAAARATNPTGALRTADEEIVDFCMTLQRETSLPVSFCSDDVNARMRAESDALLTFSLKELMNSLIAESSEPREVALAQGAAELIEQWDAQLGLSHEESSASRQHAQHDLPASRLSEDMQSSMCGDVEMHHQEYDPPRPIAKLPRFERRGRSIGDSMYAKTTQNTAAQLSMRTRQQAMQTNNATASSHNEQASYEYPADRSSASSRWAQR